MGSSRKSNELAFRLLKLDTQLCARLTGVDGAHNSGSCQALSYLLQGVPILPHPLFAFLVDADFKP
jgi:hypothetical protein